MSNFPAVTGDRIIKALGKVGFEKIRQKLVKIGAIEDWKMRPFSIFENDLIRFAIDLVKIVLRESTHYCSSERKLMRQNYARW